jgi:hypothetical protein
MERGDLKSCSFGFSVVSDEINLDEDVPVRRLSEVRCHEVSIVANPAYPETEVALRSIEAAQAAQEEERASKDDTFKPNEGMKEAAQRALDWVEEYDRGGTNIGRGRATDIVAGRAMSYKTVKRMKAFFDRHQSDKDAEGFSPGEDGYPSNGKIAWDLWGGNAGYSWSKRIVKSVEGDDEERVSAELAEMYAIFEGQIHELD